MYGIYKDGEVIARFVVPMYMKSNEPVFLSDALSLSRNVTRRTAQRWELETRLEPLSYSSNELYSEFIVLGHHTTIQIIVPQSTGVRQKRTSTVSPTATGLQGSTSITITGNTGLIPRGSFLRFANHSKVYMANSSLTDNGTLSIYPELRMAVTAQQMKHQDDVLMNCFIDTDTMIGMSFDDGLLMDLGTVKLVESV